MSYEEMFIRSFVNKSLQNRILFELQSKNDVKRNKGLSKLTNYMNCINMKYVVEDITHLLDEEAIKTIKKHIQESNGYSIVYKQIKPIEEVYITRYFTGLIPLLTLLLFIFFRKPTLIFFFEPLILPFLFLCFTSFKYNSNCNLSR